MPPLSSSPQNARPPGVPAGGFGGFGMVSTTPKLATAANVPVTPKLAAAVSAKAQDTWLLVALSPGEWERIARDKPARVLPLMTREGKSLLARPAGVPPIEDARRSMVSAYYVVTGEELGFNQRMRVELQLSGADDARKVVPYGAVYYDARGVAWTYVVKGPLTFEREKIVVERITGELAVLSEGPPLQTEIVTTGAPLLYGAEIFGK
jgi:hypothetical protein